MSRFTRFAVPMIAAVMAVIPLRAATLIKLATQAPTGTIWQKSLADLGATWTKATEGRVNLTVYADGSQGDEGSVITKIRAGGLQASLLTAGGLAHIDKAFNVFTVPFFYENDEEELAVQKALEPQLEDILQKKNFHLICWGTGGWVQIFSKKPLKNLADIKAANLYVSKDDEEMRQWYADNGFHPKAMTLADIATQLKLPNGMIDTTPNTPYLAMMTQIYDKANYMLDVHVAPLAGALVISTATWNALSPADQKAMTDSARAMEGKIRSETNKLDADSIAAMQGRKLQVIHPDAAASAELRSAATDLGKKMRGGMVPADIYDAAQKARDAARAGAKK